MNWLSLPDRRSANKWIAINSTLLIAFVVVAFLVPFSPVFPLTLSLKIIWEFYLVFIAVILSSTLIESVILLSTSNLETKTFKAFGWNQLKGRPASYVAVVFLYFNYQEISVAAFGVLFIFLLHSIL